MKDGLTQVKELKDKIHEQYIEIQELNKARKIDIEYNKHLQKEIIRLNNIINELEKRCNEMLKLYDTFNDEQRFNNWKEYKVYETILDWIEELKGSESNDKQK